MLVSLRTPAYLKQAESLLKTNTQRQQDQVARLRRQVDRTKTVVISVSLLACMLTIIVTSLISYNVPGCGWGEAAKALTVLQPGGTTQVIEVCVR